MIHAPNNRSIGRRRFTQLTHAEVGLLMGLSRGRVFQLEQLALRKMRRLLIEDGFNFEDLAEREGV